MRYVPYHALEESPNIVVDGYPGPGTVLTLSHWRGSGSPPELADDLSTQIVFRWLDEPDRRGDADIVTNNHFDEDGLCGIFAVLEPGEALARRERLIDVASAGDFGVFGDRDAARIAMALSAFGDPDRSPIGPSLAGLAYPDMAAALFCELLPRVSEIVDHPDRLRPLWEEEDARLEHDLAALRDGRITIEERPEIDLAVVSAPEGEEPPGSFAINNATRRHRVLVIQGRRYTLTYRYETWVQYTSAPTMPRIDLAPLAERLSEIEPGGGRWAFDGVDDIVPRLRLTGAEESEMAPERFRERVESFLLGAVPVG